MDDKRKKPKSNEVKEKIKSGAKSYHDCCAKVGCKKNNRVKKISKSNTLKSKIPKKTIEKIPKKTKVKNKKQKIKKSSIKENALAKINKIIQDSKPKPKKKK